MMPGGLSWPEGAGDAEGAKAGDSAAPVAGESTMQHEGVDGSGPAALNRDASVDGIVRGDMEATDRRNEEWNRADVISETAGRSGESSAVIHSVGGEMASGGAIPVIRLGSDSDNVKAAPESETEAGNGEGNGSAGGAGSLLGSTYVGTTPTGNGSAAGDPKAFADMEDRPRAMPSQGDLRRQHNELHEGIFRLSSAERRLWKRDEEVVLTPTEWTLVKLLMERAGEGLSRDDILDAVWGRHFIGDLKIVDVNIRRIRQKIEDEPSDPRFIETLWGYGYRWKRSDGR
ncbi:winged helix-turn-helix domain-containing protein [Paenibacillus mendelii]|uniref:Winged helix-turn-helix domain-containing protein n=1 Tax=Paenibacillus mendelii TaxID=206163 RepID=A0ABV6JD12_9BACL|nr:winged helix-turn-helix domain-containing protein [Paenibacillus mendelii]